jgi:Chaperone of endosialidase
MYSLTKIIKTTSLIALTLGCFGLSPQAQADCHEGCDLNNNNTFLGDDALMNNTGDVNVAVGSIALSMNTTGSRNTATGWQALVFNTTGSFNTANGGAAVGSNTTGSFNTGIGTSALLNNTTGNNNTAVGNSALFSNTTGSGNIALGDAAGTKNITGSNNIYIGNPGTHTDSSRIRIGTPGIQTKTFIAGISGATVPDGVGVIVGSNGQLGTVVSSERFKDAVKPMDKASEAILALKPVTFVYKKEIDSERIPQFGLVAEQVEKVDPDLVARDDHGKPYTVRYEAVNAMLLNEFLKEHRKVEEQARMNQQQEAKIARQQEEIAALTESLKAQAAQIQKVSDQIRTQAFAPRVVADN